MHIARQGKQKPALNTFLSNFFTMYWLGIVNITLFREKYVFCNTTKLFTVTFISDILKQENNAYDQINYYEA